MDEGSAFNRLEAEVPSSEQSPKSSGVKESALALPEEDQDMSVSDETHVSCPTPSTSGPEGVGQLTWVSSLTDIS